MESGNHIKPSVLVVDDNPLIVNVLSGLLKSVDYQVYTSANGSEALNLLQNKNVDLIICDVMMPRMDGYQLHDQVRAKSEFAHIPFVFLTALGENSEKLKGKEVGADDYVVKPFDPRELLAVVKGKITRSRAVKNCSDERYDTYRKRVIHTLSHEFRTPLVAINTGTEILLDQRDNFDKDKAVHLIEAIQRGGQRLERLVTDFMLLQQIEAGISARVFASRAKVVDVNDVIERFVEARSPEIADRGFKLHFSRSKRATKVKIYEEQILDILDRFLSNAMKFKAEDLNIELHVCPLDGEVAIEMRDRGIGMNVARVAEAVDVFGQIDRDRLEQQGGGLGLAIASRYAAINGSRLEFENREGGGSVVSLVIPVIK